MEGILLRILWVFGRGLSYWPVYRGWPVYRWPVWKVSLYLYAKKDCYRLLLENSSLLNFNFFCIFSFTSPSVIPPEVRLTSSENVNLQVKFVRLGHSTWSDENGVRIEQQWCSN